MSIKVPSWVWTALAVLAVLFGAYTAGSRSARRAVEAKQQQAQRKAREIGDNVESKLDALDNDSIRDRAGRWVRSDSSR